MSKKEEFIRSIKFTLFSISAGAIQFGSFTLMNEFLSFPPWLSYLIALILSIIWNFTLNRKFTFHSANNVPIAMLKVLGYYAVFTPLSTILEKYLTHDLLWNEYLVTFLNMMINFVTEFIFDRFVVFGASIDTAKPKKENTEDDGESIPERKDKTIRTVLIIVLIIVLVIVIVFTGIWFSGFYEAKQMVNSGSLSILTYYLKVNNMSGIKKKGFVFYVEKKTNYLEMVNEFTAY